MKTLSLLFLLFTVSSFPQNWQWLAPYPQGNPLYSICIADNYLYFFGENKTIVSSTDFGQTFNSLPPFASQSYSSYSFTPFQNIAFVDSLNGYLIDKNSDEYKTTNGGASWQLTAPNSGNILLNFSDKNNGWKFGYTSCSYTTNGGLDWTLISDIILHRKGSFSRTFALDNKVWLLKSYSNDSGGQIFCSSSPGSWVEQLTGIVSSPDTQLYLNDIKVTPSGNGIAVGYINVAFAQYQYHRKGLILKTTDSGNHWNYSTYDNVNFNSVVNKNDNDWFIIGTTYDSLYSYNNGFMSLKSSDFGDNWQFKKININYINYTVSPAVYLKDKNKIIFTIANNIYGSDDFGDSIVKLNTDIPIPTKFVLDKTNTTSSQLGFAIQYWSNRSLISTNGGVSWNLKVLPFQVDYNNQIMDIAAADGSLYLIYEYRTYKSTDKGDTWNEIHTPDIYYNYRISVLDSLHLLIMGSDWYNNHFYYSENGGRTWTISYIPGKCEVSEVKLYQPGKIISCGSYYDSTYSGFIYQSSNKGLDWRITFYPKGLSHINAFSDSSFLASGYNGVYKSVANGNLWSAVTPGTNYTIDGNFGIPNASTAYFKSGYSFYKYVASNNSWTQLNLNAPIYGSTQKIDFNYQNNMILLDYSGLLINKNTNLYQIPLDNQAPQIPDQYALYQNYPNPFNPSTKIKFSIPAREALKNVTIKLYDILGKEVAVILNEDKSPGEYEIQFNAALYNLSSGIYIYQLKRDNNSLSRKMVYLK